jgi:NAD(P)-dependent dehydrogenase (short-subunit alcohol dehydrogenase family)
MAVLRGGLLEGCCVLLAGAASRDGGDGGAGRLGGAGVAGGAGGDGGAGRVGAALSGLGATVTAFEPEFDADGEGALEWVRARAPFDALVVVCRGCAGAGGPETLLDEAWIAVSAVANGALIPSGRGGKVVLVGPVGPGGGSAEAGGSAALACAGLENLARTLSVEWARFGITVTAIAPAPTTALADVSTLVGYLLSRAGDYVSGCRLELA